MTSNDITPRCGKVLRYLVSRDPERVLPPVLVNKIEWSDLPKNLFQARATLEQLRMAGLAESDSSGYVPTTAGKAVIKQANAEGRWRS